MKRRLPYYTLLLVALIIIVAAFPFIFKNNNEPINQTINLSTSIISSLAALITLCIALLLFNKYGVESPLVEKSTSKVFALLEQIKSTIFSISSDKMGFWVKMSDPFKHIKNIEKFYGEKIIFSENYISSLDKLFEISDNPFMPPSIAQRIDKLQFNVMFFDIDENNIKNYAKVLVTGYKKIENPKFGRFNGEDMTVFQFLNLLNDIKTEVEQWIQDNSTIPVKLNL